MFRRLARAQGMYYLATGVWALVSIRTFQRVTGKKTDTWLVKTVGLLVSAIGVTLLASSTRARPTMESFTLGAGSAAALGAVEAVYAVRGQISFVYALDALVQAAAVAGWWSVLQSSEPARARRADRLHAVRRLTQTGRVSVRSEISS